MNSLTEIVEIPGLKFITLSQDKFIKPALKAYGQYANEEIELLSLFLGEQSFVLDVGANIGTHTLALAKKVPQGEVWSFEPQKFVFQILSGNVAINSLTNVRTFHCAVGRESGQIGVPHIDYKTEDNYGGLDLRKYSGGDDENYDFVPQISLDGLEIDGVTLMKIDVDGMEEEVLRGASKTIFKSRPIIYIESDRMEHRTAITGLLGTYGYRIWEHKPPLVKGEPKSEFAGDQKIQEIKQYHAINFICLPKELETMPDDVVTNFNLKIILS